MVELLGVWVLRESDVLYELLSAHLFPGCVGCDTDYEWGLFSSYSLESVVRYRCYWETP